MTWTKLGDEFADECWTLSDAAFRLHCEGLLWGNRMLTDGRLMKDDMRRWAHHPDAAEELTNAGFWEDRGDHFQIIHHAGYQPNAESVRRVSVARRNAANTRWGNPPEGNSQSTEQCNLHSDEQSGVHEKCNLHSNEQCVGDGSGRDRPGQEGDQLTRSVAEKIDEHRWTSEPPSVDCDGFPLDVR